jgi:surface carbohydrate biosynthesis protein
MKVLFIPVEIFTRSFISRLRIGVHFCSLGGTVVIGEQKKIKSILQSSQFNLPVSYLSKGEPHHESALAFLKRLNIVNKGNNYLLDEEGGVSDRKNKSMNFRYSDKTLQYFSKVFVWGLDSANHVNSKEKIVLTGNPRFDVMQINLDAFDLTITQPTVLINTSFGYGNSVKSKEELRGFLKNLLGEHFSSLEFEQHYDDQKTIYGKYLEGIEKLASSTKNLQFVIRPHPSENPKGYDDLKRRFKNITVDKKRKYPAVELAKKSALVIHYDCTTGIEAKLAGAKVLCYKPVESSFAQPLPQLVSKKVTDINELIAIITDLDKGYSKPESYFITKEESILKNYFHNYDTDANSAELIAEEIFQHSIEIDKIGVEDVISVFKSKNKVHANTLLYRKLRSIKNTILQSRKDSRDLDYQRWKSGGIGFNEVNIILKKINGKHQVNTQLEEVAGNVFVLRTAEF